MPIDKNLAIVSKMHEFSDQRKSTQINCFPKSNFNMCRISQKSNDVKEATPSDSKSRNHVRTNVTVC